ncbi:carbohydrate sulfotransferase 13-like [Ixodes scapularis]|uniref:carbohydrate sulfotransferase 13-like n=1 Tax=Ixodes scapularis TaxID=6945 RepID=UPI001A9E8251|nr:carbohydrate sulfotransferase 13-like [Ixodes scapularis]
MSTCTVRKIALVVLCAAVVASLVYFDWIGRPPSCPVPASGGTTREQTSRRSDDDFASRAKRINEVCRKYQVTLVVPNFGYERPDLCHITRCPIIIDPARKVGYCFINKVASTTVKTIFGLLLNISNTQNTVDSFHRAFHEQVRTVSPMTFLQRSNEEHYTTAMFVRHPFERLVSAYVDKALAPRAVNDYFYERYWNDVPGVKATGRNLTFPEFIDYILYQRKNEMDPHWAPYYMTCQPCTVKYEVVGKLETASRDFALFFEALGVRSKDIPHENKSGDHAYRKSARKFFKELTSDQVMRLYERFFFDFEMFGYDFRDYLH